MSEYINITADNIDQEHLCCALSDRKHQAGVAAKKAWLKERFTEGHRFRRLNARGKVFIEYAPLETAWVPVQGVNYLYIYCLWVAGSNQHQGHGQALLDYCVAEAKEQAKAGVCVICGHQKQLFLSDRSFFIRQGFTVADTCGQYELLSLNFDSAKPSFIKNPLPDELKKHDLTIFYSVQCPYSGECIRQLRAYCAEHGLSLDIKLITSSAQAKQLPGVFNNWATYYQGQLLGVNPLNEGMLVRLLAKVQSL
ncbi:MAG: YoaP domain-containing protein [Erysipelotrichaceae bacterium]|nr:YoaP domain-containing protein [Erysipelotrichaceae bacterium]